jgi:predicted nuclease with TOPRIM domain
MSLIGQIKTIWENSFQDNFKGDFVHYGVNKELFFSKLERLGVKLDGFSIATIVTTIWESYLGLEKTDSELLKERDELVKQVSSHSHRIEVLADERKKLRAELWSMSASTTRTLDECNEQIEELDTSLDTSRYFIFLSGMTGFSLGLLCHYLII